MLNWVLITDPKKPGSISFALFDSSAKEHALRENLDRQGLIGSESRPIEATGEFWRIRDYINRK
jgi:hypothetical protein